MAPNINPCFWLAVLLFYAGLVVYIVGFACPYWYQLNVADTSGNRNEINFGLWLTCFRSITATSDNTVCDYVDNKTTAEYMKAVEALQVIALFGFAVTIILKFAVICCARFRRSYRRSIEITLLASVIFGLLGVAVYGGACRSVQLRVNSFQLTLEHRPMAWAFALDLTGLVAMLVSVVMLAAFNKNARKKAPDVPIRDSADDRKKNWDGIQLQPGREQPGPPMAEWVRQVSSQYPSSAGPKAAAPYLVPYGPAEPAMRVGNLYY